MKKILTGILTVLTVSAFGQGFSIEPNFYPTPVPEFKTWSETKAFWESEANRLKKKTSDDTTDAEILYSLAIALHESSADDMLEIISILDRAIELKPKEAKYYAVRGIVKYNWGAYSLEYDIAEGCPDIEKAKELGLTKEQLTNESMTVLPTHPRCK